MNRVVKILMERDGITEQEARELIEETREEIESCVSCGDFEGAEDAIADILGLEPDYLLDII